ncbi:MAG: NUDIX domain-containing protein, partial [Saprospiraceae bacterium]|nr:NUDIX domain-containing protein [Saprospiraceae bacterium]
NSDCIAFAKNIIEVVPYKSKKIKKRNRYFHYLQIIDTDQSILLNHRTNNDIWQSLYDFPCIENESDALLNENELQNHVNGLIGQTKMSVKFPSKIHKHILSHQTIYGIFYIISIPIKFPKLIAFKAVNTKNFEQYAMPVLLTNHISEQNEWTLF